MLSHCFKSSLSKHFRAFNFQIPAGHPNVFEHQTISDLRSFLFSKSVSAVATIEPNVHVASAPSGPIVSELESGFVLQFLQCDSFKICVLQMSLEADPRRTSTGLYIP